MTILALAAAWFVFDSTRAQCRFERTKWKIGRFTNTTLCKFSISAYVEEILTGRQFEAASENRQVLADRFISLQRDRSVCMKRIDEVQSDLPFSLFWGKIFAREKESKALRERHGELSRQINSAQFHGHTHQLEGPTLPSHDEASPFEPYRRPCSSLPFLEKWLTRWLIDHPSDFQSLAYGRSLENLTREQLNSLFAHLQFFQVESQELIWRTAAAGYEKLVLAISLMQVGLMSTASLSGGSVIASLCCANLPQVARILVFTSRFFGIASFVGALAVRHATRRYSKHLKREEKSSEALFEATEAMQNVIKALISERWTETLKEGLNRLESNGKKLQKMNRDLVAFDSMMVKRSKDIEEHGRLLEDRQCQLQELHLHSEALNHKLDRQAHELRILRSNREEKSRYFLNLRTSDQQKSQQLAQQAGEVTDLSTSDQQKSQQILDLRTSDQQKSQQLTQQAGDLLNLRTSDQQKSQQLANQDLRLLNLERLLLGQANQGAQ